MADESVKAPCEEGAGEGLGGAGGVKGADGGGSGAAADAPEAVPTTANALLNGLAVADEAEGKFKYCDIGINLGDPMFRGIYHGKQAHEDDFSSVIQRALESGVRKMMVTGSDLAESTHAVEIAKQHPGLCYATVGIHPCSASTLFSSPSPSSPSTSPSPSPSPALLASLRTLAETSKATGHCTALGEIGLDYDRLHYTPQAQQVAAFGAQLELAPSLQLPLFLHSRAAGADFHSLLTGHLGRGLEKLQLRKKGLVHSFTGSMAEAEALLALPGIDIGVNGCSLKSEENLAVVRMLPLDRLQIETDGPWCEIRPSHASARFLDGWSPPPERKCVKKERWARGAMVKGRNEPCEIGRVAWVVARVKGVAVEEVVEAAWRNSVEMFGLGER